MEGRSRKMKAESTYHEHMVAGTNRVCQAAVLLPLPFKQ